MEEEKKYSKAEVIDLVHKAFSDMNSGLGIEIYFYPDGTTQSVDINEWIKNNVK